MSSLSPPQPAPPQPAPPQPAPPQPAPPPPAPAPAPAAATSPVPLETSAASSATAESASAAIASLAALPAVSESVRALLLALADVAGGAWLSDGPALLTAARRAVQREVELEGALARGARAEALVATQSAQLELLTSSSDAARTLLELTEAREQIRALQATLAEGLEAQWQTRVEGLAADNAALRGELARRDREAAAAAAAAAAAVAAAAAPPSGAATSKAAAAAVAAAAARDEDAPGLTQRSARKRAGDGGGGGAAP